MKTVFIERLRLKNFAGIPDLIVDFSTGGTSIYGDNGTGKTTILNAFLWLFFGKNFMDRQNQGIKPLTKDGKEIHRLDTEVEGEFRINGNLEKFKKVYKEKWTTKKGTTVEEFTGHVTDCYWNDVSFSATDYAIKVSSVIPEHLFKLLTNPMYFNSLHWEKQRETLIDMAGNISFDQVIDAIATVQNKMIHIINAKDSGMTMDEYSKQLSGKLKRQKEECVQFPIRINEAQRNMPQVLDWEEIENAIKFTKLGIENIDKNISDASAAYQSKADEKLLLVKQYQEVVEKYQAQKFKLQQQITQDINTAKDLIYQKDATVNSTKTSILQTEHQIKQAEQSIQFNATSITTKQARRSELNDQWQAVNAEKYTPGVFNSDAIEGTCFNCHQELPEDMKATAVETQKAAFDTNEATKLQSFTQRISQRKQEIEQEGNKLKADITALESQNKTLQENITTLQLKLIDLNARQQDQINELETLKQQHSASASVDIEAAVKEAVIADTVAQQHRTEGLSIKAKIDAMNQQTDPANEFKTKRQEMQSKLDDLHKSLAVKVVIENTQKRIEELESQESALQNEIADLQCKLNDLELFERKKMDMVEASINGRFKVVTWRLFEQQINGGERPTCQCLVDGVPYNDVNYAGKVNAGLDIINALVDHYQTSAPVFIDNRESTTTIIPMKSQIVNLVVSEPDKKLRIMNEKPLPVSVSTTPKQATPKAVEQPANAIALQPVLDFD
jgi:exonuclease SbcC